MSKPSFIIFLDKIKRLDRYLITRHINRKVQKDIEITDSIYVQLDMLENISLPNDTIIRFTTMKDGFTSLLNAKAVQPNHILVSPEWAAKLLLSKNEAIRNAFSITLGHEIMHNEGDFSCKHIYSKNKKFVNWVNEVHADFGAAQKMVNSNKQKLIDAIIYKRAFKNKKKWDKPYDTHPSWNQRKQYATNFDFDDILIDQIAKDTGCENEDLKDKVKSFYRNKYIILTK